MQEVDPHSGSWCNVGRLFIKESSMFRALVLASIVVVGLCAPARAQDVLTKESAAAVKASFVADLGTLQTKFVGLANAFPQDKYAWKPMEGVRSVAEVLMLAAFE